MTRTRKTEQITEEEGVIYYDQSISGIGDYKKEKQNTPIAKKSKERACLH